MDLAKQLATTCVMTKMALDLPAVRDQFEASSGKEKALRRHAERMRELAEDRASEEDKSLGGYAGTGIKRMLPIPQTGSEALVRLPAVAAGGAAGHSLGKYLETIDPLKLDRLRAIDPQKIHSGLQTMAGGKGVFHEMLKTHHATHNINSANMTETLKRFGLSDPHDVAAILQNVPGKMMSDSQRATQQALTDVVGGETHLPWAKMQLRNILSGKAKPGPLAEMLPEGGAYRIGGALAGAGAASALTGLPLAIRALYLKRSGGEAAARARSAMQQVLSEAEGESQSRENLLGQLPK